MRLIPTEILATREADFDARRGHLPGHYNLTLLDNPLSGQALKFYLLLTEIPDLLANEQFSDEQVFWSRYFWFLMYAKLWQAVAGNDAGLEQQAFQILEHTPAGCTPDWPVLEEVEAAVAKDVAARLRAVVEGDFPID